MGKKITIYLTDDLPKGVREVKIDQWNGKAICGPRNKLKELFKYSELDEGACLYFLLAESSEGELPDVYVGEADPFNRRGRNHDYSKDWWQDVVVFINQDRSLTKTGAKYLEHICVERLGKGGKCILQNKNSPARPTVPKEDVSGLELFYENVSIIIPFLGYDIFIQKQAEEGKAEEYEFICEGKDAKAEGILLPDGKMKVLKGSTAVKNNAPAFESHNYRKLKDELIKLERITGNGDVLIFNDDYVFNSPSAAAAIILARSASGPKEWKDKEGKTLKQITE